MKLFFAAVIFSILLCSHVYAEPEKTPGSFTTSDDRAIVNPALQFPPENKPPFQCRADARGTVAMNASVHLCVCDGKDWKLLNTDELCQWAASAK